MKLRDIPVLRSRLVGLGVANLVLLAVMPEAALSHHGRAYWGEWIVGSLALSILVLAMPVFIRGRLPEKIAAGLFCALPLLNARELFRLGIPME